MATEYLNTSAMRATSCSMALASSVLGFDIVEIWSAEKEEGKLHCTFVHADAKMKERYPGIITGHYPCHKREHKLSPKVSDHSSPSPYLSLCICCACLVCLCDTRESKVPPLRLLAHSSSRSGGDWATACRSLSRVLLFCSLHPILFPLRLTSLVTMQLCELARRSPTRYHWRILDLPASSYTDSVYDTLAFPLKTEMAYHLQVRRS